MAEKKKTLQRTADEIEDTVHLVDPGFWVGLAAVVLTIALAVVMCFFVEISEKIPAQGVLLDRSGVVSHPVKVQLPTVNSNAHLIKYNVKEGDFVKKDQIVASYQLNNIQDDLKDLENQKDNLHEKISATQKLHKKEREIDIKTLGSEQKFQNDIIKSHSATIKIQKDLLKIQKELLKKGASSLFEKQQSRLKLESANVQRIQARNKQASLVLETQKKQLARQQQINTLSFELATINTKIKKLKNQKDRYQVTRSPWSGRVVELNLQIGDVIQQGQSLLNIQPRKAHSKKVKNNKDGLIAYLFVNIEEGKRLFKGMKVDIDPTTTDPQEYGKMTGRIISVTENSSSEEHMERILGSSTEVKKIVEEGAKVLVKVKMNKSEDQDRSGYKWKYVWTTSKGPPEAIKTGTHCLGEIIVKEQKLISLLIPAFEPYFEIKQEYVSNQ